MHRLFVALRPPEPVRDPLLDLMEGLDGLRWQEEDQLHLTLRFVGEVERPQADDLALALAALRFPRFQLTLSGVGQFEHRRHGALWAGVEPKEAVRALAAKVERACQLAGLPPERRAFHPHITLARWKSPKPPLEQFLARNGDLSSPPWQVTEFRLYESRLAHSGAQYALAECYPLG